MTKEDVLELFQKHEALLSGHFKLSSGLHSEKYLQCALVLQHPDITEKLSRMLAEKFKRDKVGVVIGPALGGVTLAYEVARAIGVRGIFTERQEGRMQLRRGFFINKGERVLVCEDVVTTGGSTKEVIGVVSSLGGEAIGACSIIDRSDGSADFGVRYESLAKLKVGTYKDAECPLCKQNIPITKPGSRR